MSSLAGFASWLQTSLAANALSAMALAFLAWGASRFIRRPAVRHALWLLVLLDLLTPPIMRLAVLPPPGAEPTPGRAAEKFAGRASGAPLGAIGQAADGPASHATAAEATTLTDRPRPRATGHHLPLGLLAILGSSLLAAHALRRTCRFDRLVRDAAPASAQLMARVDRLVGPLGLRRSPPVRMTEAPVPPLVWLHHGVRATLVLPTSLIDHLPDDELDAVLAHELAHIARRDPWVRLVELSATVLCWWHPALWWARSTLRRVEEQACDARVVTAWPALAGAYARGLVETVAFLARHRTPPLSHATTADPRHDLEERLIMILRPTDSRPLRPATRLLLCSAALVALFVIPVRGGVPASQPGDGSEAVSPQDLHNERPARDAVEAHQQQLEHLVRKLESREHELEKQHQQELESLARELEAQERRLVGERQEKLERLERQLEIQERKFESERQEQLERLEQQRAAQERKLETQRHELKRQHADVATQAKGLIARESLLRGQLHARREDAERLRRIALERQEAALLATVRGAERAALSRQQLEARAVERADDREALQTALAERAAQQLALEAEAARVREAQDHAQWEAGEIATTLDALAAKQAAGGRADARPSLLRQQLESLAERLGAMREQTTSKQEAAAIGEQLDALRAQIDALADDEQRTPR